MGFTFKSPGTNYFPGTAERKGAALAAMDLTTAEIGKLCTDTNTFVIDEGLGEIKFEAEEDEVTLGLNEGVVAEGEPGEYHLSLWQKIFC